MSEDSFLEEVLTFAQAAEALHIKPRTLYNWIHNAGIIPVAVNKKTKGLTRTQIQQIAVLKGLLVTEGSAISREEWAALLQRMTQLESQVEALKELVTKLTNQ